MASIKEYPNLIFEGHSTDYQTKFKLRELIEDGVGILKVGPGLTYGMREALFALANIEAAVYHGKEDELSDFINVLEAAMMEDPKNWKKHYHGDDNALWFKRKYSFSDRSRYYMPNPKVQLPRINDCQSAQERYSAECVIPIHADSVYKGTRGTAGK